MIQQKLKLIKLIGILINDFSYLIKWIKNYVYLYYIERFI